MTSLLNSHRTTDIKPEMLSGVQTGNGNPHDKYNIAHARTNRKDNIFMQRRLYIDEAHTALDIIRFAVFFLSSFSQLILLKPLAILYVVTISNFFIGTKQKKL